MFFQQTISLSPKARGFHLVTRELVSQLPELLQIKVGLAHFFIKHTSASLTLNENADPDVRSDMEQYFLLAVPEDASYFQHTLEGADDMPAHIKASIIGSAVSIPIVNGELGLGTWQGIWLGEHRLRGGGRRVMVTLLGE